MARSVNGYSSIEKDSLATNVSAGLSTVGVRMPEHPVSLALIGTANIPIAAPSANRSGKPSPTTASHVIEDLDGKLPELSMAAQLV